MPKTKAEGGGRGSKPAQLLHLMQGQIDITREPFSERGSRLVIGQAPGRSSLFVKLGERLTTLDPHPEAYLARPAFIQPLELVDGTGEALPFETSTSPDVIVCQTRLGKFKVCFQDEETLAIGLPPRAPAGIRFRLNSEHFRRGGPGGLSEPVRSLAYATNGEVQSKSSTPHASGTDNEYILRGGLDRTILLRIAEAPALPKEVQPFSELLKKATQRWEAWFERAPAVADRYTEKYAYCWWVMANNLISPRGCISVEAMAPSKVSYIGLWMWDSALHAIAYRHMDPELARNQIRAFLTMQQEDGMLPDAIFDEAAVVELDHPVRGKVTKPPIMAWAALKVHESAPDTGFLEEILPALALWNNWWFEQNDDDGDGLAQYNHPYSSGLDDSPLWDHGLPVEAPDLNTYLFHSMNALGKMCRLLGREAEARQWEQKAEKLVERMLEDMWDENAGVFQMLHNEAPIPVSTPFHLLPLWAGRLPQAVTERALHSLTDQARFWGGLMLPSVARDDPAYDPETMWRGPVWINLNYFFIEALEGLGKQELARELREATLKIVMAQPSTEEFYSSKDGRAPEHSVPAFGWTAALFIDLAIRASQEDEEVRPRDKRQIS